MRLVWSCEGRKLQDFLTKHGWRVLGWIKASILEEIRLNDWRFIIRPGHVMVKWDSSNSRTIHESPVWPLKCTGDQNFIELYYLIRNHRTWGCNRLLQCMPGIFAVPTGQFRHLFAHINILRVTLFFFILFSPFTFNTVFQSLPLNSVDDVKNKNCNAKIVSTNN